METIKEHTQVEVSHLPLCDTCQQHEAKYDARILATGWANVCEVCFEFYGCRLGIGKGQRLVVENE